MRYLCRVGGLLVIVGALACANRGAATTPPSGTGESAPAQARLTEQNYEELMKKIGPAYQSLRKNLQANATAEAGKEAQQLSEWFGGVEKFWTQRNRPDAVKLAEQARTYASEAAGAAAAGNGEKAEAIASNMGGMCKQCHGLYRESDGQGGYRIKQGSGIRIQDSARN